MPDDPKILAAQAAKKLKKLQKRHAELGEKITQLNHEAHRLVEIDKYESHQISFRNEIWLATVRESLCLPDNTDLWAVIRAHGAAYYNLKDEQRKLLGEIHLQEKEVAKLNKLAK